MNICISVMGSRFVASSILMLICAACGEWIACGSEGGNCDPRPNNAWVRYGSDETWNYRFLANASAPCDSNFFGKPKGSTVNSCYFLKAEKPLPPLVYAGKEGKDFVLYLKPANQPPANSFFITELYYGDRVDGEYMVENGFGFLSCSSDQFGAQPPSNGIGRHCYTSPGGLVVPVRECATDSEPCAVPDASAIYPLLYVGKSGPMDTVILKNASSNGEYSCSKSSLFPGKYPPQQSENKCYFSETGKIQFVVPTGEWKQVESCEGNITCSYSLCYGVTSTTSAAATGAWSSSLSATIEAGIRFEQASLTTEVSASVSETISSAYSQVATKSCEASCDIGPNGQAFLWQWQLLTGEVNYENADRVLEPFKTFACNYICTNSTQAPQCPPGYCSDSACQTCTTDIYGDSKRPKPLNLSSWNASHRIVRWF
uniref:CEL-III C-terminal domain-containing protein n=1 Tax=Vannella robusta TaxID=1487602 RepID=A0A7S4ID01_9EUKA|mmetsp:Transcript_24018/g.30561  ORF Transcript_24018/g.30561 Transcript_24018/m.30561 type:complete len:429 (+) Transcript_24018:127-1413(+)